jgi:integrase
MARWQIHTGLRVSELLRLKRADVKEPPRARDQPFKLIDVLRKGRKPGYVIASRSLLDETASFVAVDREAWLRRRARRSVHSGTGGAVLGAR